MIKSDLLFSFKVEAYIFMRYFVHTRKAYN